jgi:hypothetical protein
MQVRVVYSNSLYAVTLPDDRNALPWVLTADWLKSKIYCVCNTIYR